MHKHSHIRTLKKNKLNMNTNFNVEKPELRFSERARPLYTPEPVFITILP